MKNDETLIDCSFEVINILNKVNERSTARTKIKVNEPIANTYFKSNPNTTNEIDKNQCLICRSLLIVITIAACN